MDHLLKITAIIEAITGLALLVVPSLGGRVLFGVELAGVAIPVARVAGIALIALGLACLRGQVLTGMLTYNALVTLYLAWVAVGGKWAGPLLWPAVALHAIFTVLLVRAWVAARAAGKSNVKTAE